MDIARAHPDVSGGRGWAARAHDLRARIEQLPPRSEIATVVGVTIGLALLMLAALVIPPRTYIAIYIHDVLIFLETASRLLDGQVPNRDFHAPLGPLAYLLPAFGLGIGGSIGDMMPLATAAFTLIVLPALLYVLCSRLRLLYALPAATFLLLLLIAPVNVGEPAESITFAMFYNRFGYALLSLTALLALPRLSGRGNAWFDGAAGALLLLLMLYLKISYFAVAFALTIGFLLIPAARRGALLAIIGVIAGALLVELFWGGSGQYVADIRSAGEASGALRGSLWTLARIVFQNSVAALLFAIILGAAIARGLRWQYIVMCLALAMAGLLLLNQNAQSGNILTLAPAALVAALAPGRHGAGHRLGPISAFAMILLALPTVLVPAVSLAYYTAKSAKPLSGDPFETELDGLVTLDGHLVPFKPGLLALEGAYRDDRYDRELFNMARNTRLVQPLAQSEYLNTIADGAALLRRDPRLAGRVFVLDMANPFNALLGRPAPRGTDAWNHHGRTFTEQRYRAPAAMFAEVDVVLDPKAPMELNTNQGLRQVYRAYLSTHFEPIARSTYWTAYRRRRG